MNQLSFENRPIHLSIPSSSIILVGRSIVEGGLMRLCGRYVSGEKWTLDIPITEDVVIATNVLPDMTREEFDQQANNWDDMWDNASLFSSKTTQ